MDESWQQISERLDGSSRFSIEQHVEESLKRDYDGSRRAYAMKVSTSEALRKRVLAHHAGFNGKL